MTYLNPEIFPDDWSAILADDDDCCEESRRHIRQLWLRQLFANRVSTQNDAQLQNSTLRHGNSCSFLSVVDRKADPLPPSTPSAGSPPSVPPLPQIFAYQRIYAAGGVSPTTGGTTSIDRLSVVGDTIARISATLRGLTYCAVGMEAADRGYLVDQRNHGNRLEFATETRSNFSIAAGNAHDAMAATATNRAFIFGGYTAPNGLFISEFVFATEQRGVVSATLTHAGTYSAEGQSETKSYIGGGRLTGVGHHFVQAFTISTKTVAVLSNTLGATTFQAAGFSSPSKAYFCGGSTNGSAANTTAINAVTFSSEAVAVIGTTLSSTRVGAGGGSGAGAGYVIGGATAWGWTPHRNSVEKIVHSSEARTVISAVLPSARAYPGVCHAL